MNGNSKRFALGLVLLLTLFLLGFVLLLQPAAPAAETHLARQAQADRLGLTGIARSAYLAGDLENPNEEGMLLDAMGDFWAIRSSYPTGQFSQAWLLAAADEDRQLAEAVPAGEVTYTRENNPSPLALDPAQFTSLGPAPLNMTGCQGCFEYGLAAGRTNVIVSDPVSPSIAYLGSDGGGVWKTTNCCSANTTWTPTMDDPALNSTAIGDIVMDPNDHNTLYAGTGDLRYGSWSFGSAGLLKTTDAGATWAIKGADVFSPVYSQPAGVFPQYQAIGKVRVDPNNSNRVVVGTKTGLYFSYDAGDSWDGPCYTNSFLSQRQDVTGMLVRDEGAATTLYVAIGTRGHNTAVQPDLNQNGANGIYTTTIPASGCPASWNLITTGSNGWPSGTGGGTPYPTNSLGRIDLAIAPSNPDVIYAQVASIPTRGQLGVWRTTDGGVTWQQRSNVNGLLGCFGDWPQNWYDQGLAVDPNNPDNVFMSTVDLFRSTNGGSTFTNLTCGYAGGNDVHVDHHALAFVDGTSDTLLVGTDGGAYVTLNANTANPNSVSFINLNSSLNTIEFYAGDITANFATSSNPGINAGAQDNGSSVYVWNGTNPGPAVWQMTTGGDGMFARIEPVLGQRWYQESQNGNLKVSTSGPYGFYQSASGSWSGDRKSFIMPYEIAKYTCPPTGCTHLIAGTYRVWETVQGAVPASSWYVNSPDLTKGTLGNRSFIQQLSYAVSDDSIAIVGTLDGNVHYGFGMGQGTANSATWVDVTGGNQVLPNRPVMDVTTDPVTPTIGYAALGGFDENTPFHPGHVYQVTCNASCTQFTWVDKSGNLPNIPINTILANPKWPQQVFAGSDWGLYFTNNIFADPPDWQKFTAGLPSTMIWEMSIDRGFTTLALFTRSRGAYAWPLPDQPDYFVGAGAGTLVAGQPGATMLHQLTIANDGLLNDGYALTVSGAQWQTAVQTTTPISVTAGTRATVDVTVTIPPTAVLTDSDAFTLTVTSQNDPAVMASVVGTTLVTGTAGIEVVDTVFGAGTTGDTVQYQIAVTNSGNITDVFAVTPGTSVWPAAVGSLPSLAPQASAVLTASVTIGSGASDIVSVTLTSTFDPAVTRTVTIETRRLFYVSVGDDTLIAGQPGETVLHRFVVTNKGLQDDVYAVNLDGSQWPTVISATGVISAAAGMTTSIAVSVTIPTTGLLAESDAFTLTVFPMSDPFVSADVMGTTAVSGTAAIQVIDAWTTAGITGETVQYQITVTNSGSVTDTFAIQPGASAWPAAAGSLPPLAPQASASFTATVTIGSGAMDVVTLTLASTFDPAVTQVVTLETRTYLGYLPAVIRPSN